MSHMTRLVLLSMVFGLLLTFHPVFSVTESEAPNIGVSSLIKDAGEEFELQIDTPARFRLGDFGGSLSSHQGFARLLFTPSIPDKIWFNNQFSFRVVKRGNSRLTRQATEQTGGGDNWLLYQ